MQDIFKDGTIKTTKIPQQVLENLRSPDLDFLTKSQNETLRQGMKNLLKRVDGTPEGTECAYYYDMRAKFLKWEMGEPGAQSIGVYNPLIDYIAMHNHPSGGTFSPGDIKAFNSNEEMRIMLIVGNNGDQYLIRKTNNYNAEEFLTEYSEFIIKLINEETSLAEALNKCSEFILKGAEKYGYQYRKII